MSLHEYPKKPGISRFVAPWDTSGWYFMAEHFAPGCRIYSNADITVTECPEILMGCDYIVTYDSATDGFDDKQEVDFFIEQTGEVYAALDADAPADFPTGFARTDLVVRTDAGDTYRLFMRPYARGAHVHLDAFSSPGRHFFVVFRPTETETEKPLPEAKRFSVAERHETRETCWFVHDCFAQANLSGYDCRGDVRVCAEADNPKRHYLRLQSGAGISRACETSGQDELSMALDVPAGTAALNFAGVTVQLGGAQASINGQNVPDIADSRYVVAFKRFHAPQRCEVWLNNRPAMMCACDAAAKTPFTLTASEAGEIRLNRVDWKDQTDVPMLAETFASMPMNCRLLAETQGNILQQRGIGSFLRVTGSGAVTFPAIRREAMVEITCRASGEESAVFPEVRDADGHTIMKAALFANSLFLSDGEEWRRICGGYAPWQYFPGGNWYRLTISLDFASHTFDVNVDGALRAKGFRMALDAENAAQVLLTAADGAADWCGLRVWDASNLSRNMLPPGEKFNVRDYGAKGDGSTLDTLAIQRALDAAEGKGGVVVVPEGTYLTKQVQLRSDTMLWLDKNAVLLASQNYATYPHVVPCESLVAVRNTGRALVYAERARNISISGGGELNANGRCRFKVNDPKGINKLYTSRPDNLYMACCEDIRVSDVRFTSAAYWTLVPLSSRFVTLEHLMLDCMNTPNRDGIDPVDCHDLSVRHCCIMAGDDGFCLKTADRMGCRNIFAEDLVIQSLASAIKIGTDSYAKVENVTVRRCILKNVNRCGIAVETVDGAAIRNCTFEDIDMTDCGGPMYMTIGHRNRKAPQFPVRVGSMAHIVFRRIGYRAPYLFSRCKTVYESLFIGDSAENKIRDVLVADCDLLLPGGCRHGVDAPQPIGEKYPEYDRHGLSSGAAFTLRFCEDVRFENNVIQTERPDVRPLVMIHDC